MYIFVFIYWLSNVRKKSFALSLSFKTHIVNINMSFSNIIFKRTSF